MQKDLSYTSSLNITENHTALKLGSGDMNVLGTPAMNALMENAAMQAAKPLLASGQTTVGTYLQSSHIKPSLVGETITATAILTETEGRKLIFKIETKNAEDEILGEGVHHRFIVDREKFLSKLKNNNTK